MVLVPTCVIDLVFISLRPLLMCFHSLLLCSPRLTSSIPNPSESGWLLPQPEVFSLEALWQNFWIQSWVQAWLKACYSPAWIQYLKSLYILGGLPWIISQFQVSSFMIQPGSHFSIIWPVASSLLGPTWCSVPMTKLAPSTLVANSRMMLSHQIIGPAVSSTVASWISPTVSLCH